MKERGQLGGFSVQTVVILALIAGIAGAWYFNVGPFGGPGDTYVDIGLIDESGEELSILKSGAKDMRIVGPGPGDPPIDDPSDSDGFVGPNGNKFTDVYGDLYVTAQTESSGQPVDLTIDYRVNIVGGNKFYDGSTSKTISSGSQVKVLRKSVSAGQLLGNMPVGSTRHMKFSYDITATHGDKTKTTSVSGEITITHKEKTSTLSISADVNSSTTMILNE